MNKTLDRISGVFFLVFGLVLYFGIIPLQTETVTYGWSTPATIPKIVALIIILGGLITVLAPIQEENIHVKQFLKTGVIILVVIIGLFIIEQVGFVWAAPILSLGLLWLAYERRIPWLCFGCLGVPALLWFSVSVLLERPLP